MCRWRFFIISIFQSHKIAGPLFKVKRFLKSIREGKIPEKVAFRKGDHFQDLASDLNEAFFQLENIHFSDISAIQQINDKINLLIPHVPEDKKYLVKEISSIISKIQDAEQQQSRSV